MIEECLDLESHLEYVQVARQWTRRTLAEWELENFVDDAGLLASELVANGVLHARTALRLTLTSDGLSWVRVEVYDENTRMPVQVACPEDATSGRGLNLVASLASAWGTENRGLGKVVWATLGELPRNDPDDCVDVEAVAMGDAVTRLSKAGGASGSTPGEGSVAAGEEQPSGA